MCGIVGFLDRNCEKMRDRGILAVMTSSLAHRGPNAEGIWQSENGVANLGHRRLAILDLSPAGAQPMRSSDGRYTLIFNGEIYNYKELRNALTSEGELFVGSSDTEVLLVALIRWGGQAALCKLNGMFAFALWDDREQKLLLARDRFGEKPLYYGWRDGVFMFGSELKGIAKHPCFRREIDPEALSLFTRFSYIPCPWSIFKGIRKLPPGHMLTVVPGGGEVESKAYWRLYDLIYNRRMRLVEATDCDFIDELERSLLHAVKERMQSDVPLGAFLSGGIDSSLIVALMQAQSSRPIKTFTIGFSDSNYNEAGDAARVANHLGTEHSEYYISDRECMDMLHRIPDYYDEPFADSSQIPTAFVSQFASRHVTVALSGDAGDEFWGGYNRYVWSKRLWPWLHRIPIGFRRRVAGLIARGSSSQWEDIIKWGNRLVPRGLRVRGGGDKMHKFSRSLAATTASDMYEDLVSQWPDPSVLLRENVETSFLESVLATIPPNLDEVERMMYLDIETFLPDDILCKVDRASMAMGLEVRVPFLDNNLVRLAWSIPSAVRINRGFGKWPLRQVLKRYVPEAAFNRPKTGFGIPLDAWMRGPMREWVEDMLSEDRLHADGFFKPEIVRQEWRHHISGRSNRQGRLWNVLMFQSWLHRS
jgi:asparagine synthase (glutamine-hydrolysing)